MLNVEDVRSVFRVEAEYVPRGYNVAALPMLGLEAWLLETARDRHMIQLLWGLVHAGR